MHHALVVLTLVSGVGPSFVSAQEAPAQPPRPDQGLYRGADQGTGNGDLLLLSGTAFESYDDNFAAGQAIGGNLFDPRSQAGGFYSGADAALFYGRRTDRLRVGTNVGAASQYYPRLNDLTQTSYHGGVDLALVRGRRTFQAAQGVSWMPFFMLGISPVADAATPFLPPAVPDAVFTPPLAGRQDLAILSRSSRSYQTGLTFTQALNRRSSFALDYGLSVSDLSEGLVDLTHHSGNGTVKVQLGRNISLLGRYGYQDAKFDTIEGEKRHRIHDLDVSFLYQRPLSPTRAMSFRAGSGASILRRDEENHPELAGHKYYQTLGSAGFTYMFRRTWYASADYRRALQLFAGVSQPFYTNSVSAGLQGRLSRRVDFLASVAYSEGAIAFDSLARDHNTRFGSARLRYALTRYLALLGEYAFYTYDFSRQVQLPEGVLRRLERQVLRGGVTFDVPLWHQARP